MDNKYGTMFKRLMNERNELRKYIIDICKLLDIDTNQFVLGANCLEFYAVLYSTAKNKISYMDGYMRTVENSRNEFEKENKFLKEENKRLARVTQHKEQEYEKIKQALDEIEKTFFDTFGIEPKDRFKGCTLGVKYYSEFCKKETCRGCDCEIRETVSPQITDHILLELICIAHISPVITFVSRDVKSLKEEVLMVLCNWVNNRNIKQQVQALFKEEN